jgi:mannose-6-phosphate isomerase
VIQDRPILLAPNFVRRPYRGGQNLARFRGADIAEEQQVPEEWLASTTNVYGQPDQGPSVLPDGRSLKDAIAADPVSYLGPQHFEVFGADPALLVKLLDAQQRLSVHLHPTRQFARARLGKRYGKTEAWCILAAEPDAGVYYGFREEIEARDLLGVVESGEGSTLLQSMNRLDVSVGDVVYVPGGIPHAIDAGVFMIELQEPSDLLVRLEWSGYAVGTIPSDLGLGFPLALEATDRSAWNQRRLDTIVSRGVGSRDGLLPSTADTFFRVERPASGMELAGGFRIVVVVEGQGELSTSRWSMPIEVGQCLLLPWACGGVSVHGDVEVVCCRPGDPDKARAADPELSSYQ